MTDPVVPTGRKKQPEECTARAVTPPFSGLNTPSAVAQCPAGMVCADGEVVTPDYGMVVTASRLTEDGTGWYGEFTGGPSGGTALVTARCVPAGEATANPSED